jgi:ATP-dependent phosphofructokinase / diphosphate-dependent phosphofructokinase
MSSPLSRPSPAEPNIRRVAILFAGGPAPAANAVISTAAVSFIRKNVEVYGILNGYSHLVQYDPDYSMAEGRDYIRITHNSLKRTRNSQGVIIGTARANPGKDISEPAHLMDPVRSRPLKAVYDALVSMGVDALISIGGDDTLKTANKFKLYQEQLPPGSKRIPVVHLPKTIDNDYSGIDFTFGYFTAVEVLAGEIRNLLADAESTRSYFIAETMGRSAGWLAYGAAIAGEASLVVSVEDISGKCEATEQITDPKTGRTTIRRIMNVDEVIGWIVALMRAREEEGKQFGVIVVAEGLAEYLPSMHIEGVPRDEHGHIAVARLNLGRLIAEMVGKEYAKQTGKKRKITGVQLGYECRCARPQAFDVMLGSQLGVGAYRALIERRLDGVMVSVRGQLELDYVPFDRLVDPTTLVTVVRYIEPSSDFHRLARFLETYVHE